jgi:Nucleotidyl transferase AbiEii toxin, Type IV TA system
MLHTSTVYPATLGLLKQLMAMPELNGFNLAGGTSLSLQIGHRISVDLDFFGNCPFEAAEILDLVAICGQVEPLKISRNILILDINGVKVDVVNYRYPLLKPVINIDGIRLLSTADIGAMKLAAIAGRGRKRDFVDLYFILQEYTLTELIQFYNQKYTDGSEMMVARSLTYFGDAEDDTVPELLQTADWQVVESTILQNVKELYG